MSSLLDALPSGSYLAITNLTADFMDPAQAAQATQAGQQGGITYVPRTQAEVAAFLTGLDLIDPGVVPMQAWRPDGGALAVRTVRPATSRSAESPEAPSRSPAARARAPRRNVVPGRRSLLAWQAGPASERAQAGQGTLRVSCSRSSVMRWTGGR